MYEIKRCEKEVNGMVIETWKSEITSANILEVEVGTNGYQGGDSGHGSRTYFSIRDLASTNINVELLKDNNNQTEGFVLELGGDCELETFTEALEFALKVLKEHK